VARLLAREITGSQLYFDVCDGKLTPDDLNPQGNDFTAWYDERQFANDYEQVFKAEIPATGHAIDDFCSIADSFANCDRLVRALDQRFSQWQAAQGSNSPSFKPHIGHAALLLGAAGFLILLALTLTLTGAPLKAIAVALAFTGAFGVYRCSTDLETPTLATRLLTALALVPVAGSFACLLVVLRVIQRLQDP